MSASRVALYVYEKAEVTLAPDVPADFYQMGDDYSAKFLEVISEPVVAPLTPGVYGFVYQDKHGIEAGDGVTLVVDVHKKKPWPAPPPPPPPPFLHRRDWSEHLELFMSPLGVELDLDDNADRTTG